MKIGLGSDHGGYNLKEEIKKHLQSKGIECVDFGTENGVDSVDYPIYGEKVAKA
ncbi:RpiB/LacA/LacB family sugar-phosphate isomerase, partial [Faecalibacillus intestinalis]